MKPKVINILGNQKRRERRRTEKWTGRIIRMQKEMKEKEKENDRRSEEGKHKQKKRSSNRPKKTGT
jgi:hypothetical protein